MDHQDWKPLVLNSVTNKNTKEKSTEKNALKSKYVPAPDTVKLVPTANIGSAIANARNTKTKTQQVLANEIGVSQTVLARWENNKEIPTNSQIAVIERKLGIKLPRSKIVKNTDQ